MVRTNSMVLELGFQLPNFQMLNANSPINQYFNFLIHLNQLGSLPGVHFILQPKEGI